LFHDGRGDLVSHLTVVDGLGGDERNLLRCDRLDGLVRIVLNFALYRVDRVFASVQNRVVADEQRRIPSHGGQSLRLGSVEGVAGDGSGQRHHLRLDHQRHRVRAPSDETEDDVASASVEERQGLGVSVVGDVISLDREDDVTTLQVTLSGRSRLDPLNDQRSVEVLSSGETESPRRGEGVPVNVDFDLVPERHLGGRTTDALLLLSVARRRARKKDERVKSLPYAETV